MKHWCQMSNEEKNDQIIEYDRSVIDPIGWKYDEKLKKLKFSDKEDISKGIYCNHLIMLLDESYNLFDSITNRYSTIVQPITIKGSHIQKKMGKKYKKSFIYNRIESIYSDMSVLYSFDRPNECDIWKYKSDVIYFYNSCKDLTYSMDVLDEYIKFYA